MCTRYAGMTGGWADHTCDLSVVAHLPECFMLRSHCHFRKVPGCNSKGSEYGSPKIPFLGEIQAFPI